MATVQSIIEQGYAGSTANEAGDLAGDTELIAYLNGVYQAAYALAAVADPSAYQERATITCVASVATLPADILDIPVVRAGGVVVHIAPVNQLHRSWHHPPVMFRESNTLVSRGLPGDPGPSQVLTLSLVASPDPLTTLTQVIDTRFPVRHHDMLVGAVRLYLAIKDEGRAPAQLQATQQQYNATVKTFLALIGLSLSALETPHGRQLVQRPGDFAKGTG